VKNVNSVQSDILARIIDKLEKEGCTNIHVSNLQDYTDNIYVVLKFNVPAEPE